MQNIPNTHGIENCRVQFPRYLFLFMVNLSIIICARGPVTWSAVERYFTKHIPTLTICYASLIVGTRIKTTQPIQDYCNNDESYDDNSNNDNDDNNNDNDNNNNDNDDDSNDDNNNNHGGGGGGRDGEGDECDGDGDNDGDDNNDNGDLWYENLSSPGMLKACSQSVYIMIYIAVTYHYVYQPLLNYS